MKNLGKCDAIHPTPGKLQCFSDRFLHAEKKSKRILFWQMNSLGDIDGKISSWCHNLYTMKK